MADDRPFLSAGGGNGQQQINETEASGSRWVKLNGKAAIYYWPRKSEIIKNSDQFKHCLGHVTLGHMLCV